MHWIRHKSGWVTQTCWNWLSSSRQFSNKPAPNWSFWSVPKSTRKYVCACRLRRRSITKRKQTKCSPSTTTKSEIWSSGSSRKPKSWFPWKKSNSNDSSTSPPRPHQVSSSLTSLNGTPPAATRCRPKLSKTPILSTKKLTSYSCRTTGPLKTNLQNLNPKWST